ncbi:MAG: T9SS type A sorting domain-containing protein [Flavobacterium sp.]|nr:T9SS type A sorting domain-containing protein [Flavobacterium sp.]
MIKILFKQKWLIILLLCSSVFQLEAQCTNEDGLYVLSDKSPTVTGNNYNFSNIGGGSSGTNAIIQFDAGGNQKGCRQKINLPSIPAIDNKERVFKLQYNASPNITYTVWIELIAGGQRIPILTFFASPAAGGGSRDFILPSGVSNFYIQASNDTCTVLNIGWSQQYIVPTYLGIALNANSIVTNLTGCSAAASNNGKIELFPTDGTAPYTYTWTSSVAGFTAPSIATSFISNLAPGTYSCIIADNASPAKSRTVTFVVVTNYDLFDANIVSYGNCSTSNNIIIKPLASVLYSNNFDQNSAITLQGDAIVDNKNIRLVPDQGSKSGKLIINNMPVNAQGDIEVSYKFYMLNKSGADGYSFNFGNDSFASTNENGVNQGLAVRFRTNNQDNVSVAWNNTQVVAPFNINLELGTWIDVNVKVVNGIITLYVNGTKIANTLISGYVLDSTYKMIFAARTGGSSNEMRIDDVAFGNPSYQYSIDGTTYQTSNVFSNITLPANRLVPVWLKQNNCVVKIRDYVYPALNDFSQMTIDTTPTCDPTSFRVRGLPFTAGGSTGFDPIEQRAKVYENIFLTNDGYSIGGSAKKVADGILLTRDAGDNKGFLLIETPPSISKDFEIVVTHKSLNKSGADGFSVSYGNPAPIINGTVDPEQGVSTGLAVRFKTNNQDNVAVFYNNTQFGPTFNTAGFNIETGNVEDFKVIVKGVNVKIFQGVSLLIDTSLPSSYTTDPIINFNFMIAARTGGSSNENLIKKVAIFDSQQLLVSNDNVAFNPVNTTSNTLPLNSSNIVNNKAKLYFKFANGCTFLPALVNAIKTLPVTTGNASQNIITSNPTVADINAPAPESGMIVRFYDNSTTATNENSPNGTGYLPLTTALTDGGIYYVKTFYDPSNILSGSNICNAYKQITVTLTPLKTNDFEFNSKVVVYPNPSASIFSIETEANVTAELFDILGHKLQSNKFSTGTTPLNLSGYSGGIYFLKITNEINQTKTIQLLKQ